jgi:hypothetical protein
MENLFRGSGPLPAIVAKKLSFAIGGNKIAMEFSFAPRRKTSSVP